MSSSIESLSACTSPGATARVFNPTRPEYYLKDDVAAAAKAEAEKVAVEKPKPEVKAQSQPPQTPQPAVKVTLSDEAKAALKDGKPA